MYGRAGGGIEFAENVCRMLVADTEHDAVGMDEVVPAVAFAQEFGVVGHTEVFSDVDAF